MNRFIGFFLEEQQLRWKVYLISGGIAFVYALVNLSAFHRSEERVSLETVLVLFMLVAIFVAVYVAKGRVSVAETGTPKKVIQFGWKLAVAGTVAAALLVSMYQINIPELQAAIIDLKLKSFATSLDTVKAANLSDNQLRSRYQRIESIVGTSSTNQIPVDPNLLQQTQTAVSRSLKAGSLSEQTKQLGWATTMDLESLFYTRKVETGEISPIPARQIANTGGYVINSTVVLDKGNPYIRGDHSWFALGPGGGSFAIKQSNVVFDGVDFLGFTALSPINLLDDRSSALVRDSILKNVTQYLDRIAWVDVRFENSRLLYTEGAPLRLRNVSFKSCDLSLSQLHFPPDIGPPPAGPVGSELQKRIREADGKPITFTYEPQH